MKPLGADDATAERVAAQTWRVTTAARAFLLAFAAGQVLSAGAIAPSAHDLASVIALAVACCVSELHPRVRSARWAAWVEGSLTGVLIGAASTGPQPLLVCLAIPALVAGIRHGVLTTALTVGSTAASLALCASVLPVPSLPTMSSAWGWLVLGLGGGLLGSVQSRSARSAVAAQASYAAAHRLLEQLHSLVQRRDIDLDVTSLATALRDQVGQLTRATSCTVWVRFATQEIELLSASGEITADEQLAGRCLGRGAGWTRDGLAVVPLRSGDHVFGAVVARFPEEHPAPPLQRLQARVDEHAIRLDTALLVDGVRASATDAERRRLARDIHDGVAQRVVSLGYIVDELVDRATDTEVERTAEELRSEITRVVGELRFSVFDLRQDLLGTSVSAALSEYVQQLSRRSDLRVHLVLDERGRRLPRRVEAEVIRVAQEAIANVARHADALNVWVRMSSDDEGFRLSVEDDGVGMVQPRPGHYGLHTMRERAEHIGAGLHIGPRSGGGTVVSLCSSTDHHFGKDVFDDDPRLARR